jgi:hypothetical protein
MGSIVSDLLAAQERQFGLDVEGQPLVRCAERGIHRVARE